MYFFFIEDIFCILSTRKDTSGYISYNFLDTPLMHISLKKQIHVTKISKNFKTVDIILFFAIFDLPQQNRQLIKKGHTYSSLHLSKINNFPQESSFPWTESFKLTEESFSLPINFTSYVAKQPNNQRPIFAKNKILHINNKSMQHIDQCLGLPFSGQTYMFAVQNEEHAYYMFTSAKSLYRGIFLGGFYKNIYINNRDLKALCIAIFHKKDRYIHFFRILNRNIKHLCITSQICTKLLILTLYKISLDKKEKTQP